MCSRMYPLVVSAPSCLPDVLPLLRFDAIKHMDEGFCADFVKHMRTVLSNVSLAGTSRGAFSKAEAPFLASQYRSPTCSVLESSGRIVSSLWMASTSALVHFEVFR